jgi:hypothetical protein
MALRWLVAVAWLPWDGCGGMAAVGRLRDAMLGLGKRNRPRFAYFAAWIMDPLLKDWVVSQFEKSQLAIPELLRKPGDLLSQIVNPVQHLNLPLIVGCRFQNR